MAVYYITNNSRECYITLSGSGKYNITADFEKAHKFTSSKKAWAYIESSVPLDKRDNWHVEMHDPNSQHPMPDSISGINPEDRVDWDEALKNIGDTYLKVSKYREQLNKQLSSLDLEQCDILHACEFYKCNVVDGYKLYKLLHDLRIRRRWVKDEIKRADTILMRNYSDVMSGEIQSDFSALDNQQYTPRVLKELFEKKK